jgi:colicin import membrane protein
MPSATERIDFLPPAPPGLLRAFGLAIVAHLFLLAALTWGVNWKRQHSDTVTAEAELWSSVPQQAAPKAQEAPPPPPLPEPEPVTPKVIAPPLPATETKPQPQPAKVDIALEKEKEKKKQLALEQEQERQLEKEAQLKEDKAKKAAEKKAQEALAQKKAAEDAKRAAQKKAGEAAQADKEAKESAEQRDANLRRIAGLAGASGGAGATGVAQQSTGWSSSYGGKVKARVKPNLVFSGTTSGNPNVTLRIRLAPDGTILGRPQVLKSSGNGEWDEAVVRAFEKTEVLPKDIDGQVRGELEVVWRPND